VPCAEAAQSRWVRAAGRLALCGVLLGLAACASTDASQAAAARARPAAPKAAPPAPSAPRSIAALRLQAARRIMQANPEGTYTGPVPQVLLAIPVLEIELKADGQVRRIEVLRRPSQAPETTQMAIDAVRRAAPFGDVSHLPRPWKFTETFLFNDARQFKPRSLDM
jgi:outer membrane biosynthesis protein TonB